MQEEQQCPENSMTTLTTLTNDGSNTITITAQESRFFCAVFNNIPLLDNNMGLFGNNIGVSENTFGVFENTLGVFENSFGVF